MPFPEAAHALRKLDVLCRGGLPLLEALELVVIEEVRVPGLREAHQRLLAGAPFADCFPELPPTLKPLLRHGERTGTLLEALKEVWSGWTFAERDHRLPFLYLGRALETLELRHALEEGREVFACHWEWQEIARELEQGKPLGEAARGRWRVLPPPLEAILARAESSGTLPRTLQAIARGAGHGLIAYEPAKAPSLALRQGCFSMALMLIAGAPLAEAVQVAGAPLASSAFEEEGLAAMMSRHPEVFPPSVAALIRRAEYAGDLAKTLEYVAVQVSSDWSPLERGGRAGGTPR